MHIGVEMSDPMGECDGCMHGRRYFKCPHKCGSFFKITQIQKKIPAEVKIDFILVCFNLF